MEMFSVHWFSSGQVSLTGSIAAHLLCALNQAFILPGHWTRWNTELHSESKAYREPVETPVLSLICSHYIVESTLTS